MKVKILDGSALRSIPAYSLHAYAMAEGWTAIDQYGENSVIYHKDESSELVLPISDKIADYSSVVSDFVEELAKNEGRSQLQVYRDLVRADKDVIRVRAPAGDEAGSISFEDGLAFVAGSYSLLQAAACAAREPQPTYRAGLVKHAVEYMKGVRLGQTEPGSYVINLLAPVPPLLATDQIEIWPEHRREPFERLVTMTFVGALFAAEKAAQQAMTGEGLSSFYSAVEAGVSSNLCDAIADLIEFGEGFDVGLTWAKTRPLGGRQQIEFSPNAGKVYREAARAFRELEPRYDEYLTGVVVRLKREPQQESGSIGLRVFLDGAPIAVSARVDGNLYHKAVLAHDQKALVEVHGDLQRVGQRWQMKPLYDLNVISAGLFGDDDKAPL